MAVHTVEAAIEAYELERQLGANHEDALRSAVAAGMRHEEQVMIHRVMAAAQEYAEELESQEPCDCPEDDERALHYAEALEWLIDKLGQDLPSATREGPYLPADGDHVEVLIRGEVQVYVDRCGNCGSPSTITWSVTTPEGVEYDFDFSSSQALPVVKIVSGVPATAEAGGTEEQA